MTTEIRGSIRLATTPQNQASVQPFGRPKRAHTSGARVDTLLVGAAMLGAAAQFFLIPLTLGTSFACKWLLLPIVILTPMHWGLFHEAIHYSLIRGPARNRRLGRVLGILLGFSWDVVRFGHLTHHRANRHALDRPDIIPPNRSWLAAALPYYVKLLGGHAAMTAGLAALAFLPSPALRGVLQRAGRDPSLAAISETALAYFGDRARVRRIRTDFACSSLLLAIALVLWSGAEMALLLSILGRMLIISLLDNAHHYGTPLDIGAASINTAAPRWLGWLLLNQNLHHIHHSRPQLGWRELVDAFRESNGRYQGQWACVVIRQLRGPLRAPMTGP